MTDRVDAAVPHVQPAGPEPVVDGAPSQVELPRGDEPMLTLRELDDLPRLPFALHFNVSGNLGAHAIEGAITIRAEVQHKRDISHRRLGDSELEVSVLALGSWQTFERIGREQGVAVMRAAREHGIDFLDDARYHDEHGRSEVIFGELFRAAGYERDKVVVANKLWWEFWPRQTAAQELDASLARMGFDYIDLIYAERPPPDLPLEALLEQVTGLIAAGKARAWGVLNWPPELIARAEALADPPPCAAQLPYSLVRREWVENPAMERTNVSVVASAVLAGGALTGKYPGPGRLQDRLEAPDVKSAIQAAPGAAAAIRFALAHPRVATVLFGATTPEQVAANVGAL
jgi:aryl-alcohol dehydrogenase-like predicted oxidoreductase